ncbi:hypothetical protein THOM_3206 [Trachipleistophora hominis]|uniref:Uncharacterized protein n=1 Tax=Trachipleistophora hominis TaxID=72359 RepID=L7JR24_TRAHO|nr:hypothetical protein THOM_3206 [Trachipleistophora hominis]
MEGTGHDVLVGMQNIRNYVVSISEKELTEILLKKNIKGHFITNSIKIARNCNYDIVVPLLKLIEEVEDKRAILEYALDYYSTRRRVLQGSKMVSVLISSKAYIDDVLRSKLHDFLGKLTNKRSYNCAIEKLYENGLLDHVEVDMLDRTSRFVLDENIKDLDIANECLSVYQKGRKQQICNGYVIKDWERTAKNFWCTVLDTMDEIPSAMLTGAHLVHLFAVPEKYHCRILPLLARAINEDNCYEIARVVIDRDINHVEVLTLVYNYVKSRDLFNDQFYVSDEELDIILREHKDIKAVSMILQLVNNQVIEHIPFILPFLIQEKEFLCLERLVKRYKNIMITYLQQFIEMGMNVKVFLYFDAGSTVQKMIQMAAYDTLTDYIAVLPYIDQNTCQEILRTGNAGLIQPMILKIAQSKKECTEVHDLLKDERDESVREFIKKNAIESKVLRNVVKEWI